MKRVLLFVLMLAAVESRGQNWNPLGPVGVKRYFVNEDGYLRGMRVDSVRVNGGDSVWYPFRTLRGAVPSQTLDSNGSSWLGKAVRKRPDGTWLFNTWKNDTIVMKSLATVGDTWRFYDDTGTLWYRATLTNTGTQTVLGMADSFKTVTLTAMSGVSPLPSDSLDGWTVVLSKQHGFVSVPDLYMLPYPKDGSTSGQQDLFFGIITGTPALPGSPGLWGTYAGVRRARFSIISYEHPTPAKIYATWQPGDALYYSWSLSQPTFNMAIGRFVDTVNARTASTTGDILSLNRWKWLTLIGPNTTQSTQLISADSIPLIDTARMPEEYLNIRTCYYHAGDASYSNVSPLWHYYTGFTTFTGSGGVHIGQDVFKAGVGHVYHYVPCGQYPCDETRMLAYRIGGTTYGTPFGPPPLRILDAGKGTPAITVAPIPASTSLLIQHPTGTLAFHLADVTGRPIKTVQLITASTTTHLDVSSFPQGIYTLVATAADGSRHTQKVLIAR